MQVYDIWRNQGHKFNLITFKEFLIYCSTLTTEEAPQWADKAFKVFEDLKSDGNVPDSQVYITLMQAAARAKQLDKVFEVNEWFDRDKMERGQLGYLSLIRACAISDEKEKAKKFFDTMIKEKLGPNWAVFDRLYNDLKNL
jgi:pentatricopeptide repeat protein